MDNHGNSDNFVESELDMSDFEFDSENELTATLDENADDPMNDTPKHSHIKRDKKKHERKAKKAKAKKSEVTAFFRKIAKAFKKMSVRKKIMIASALLLSLCVILIHPALSWFKLQKALKRYEKISSPNSLYIAAARREDQINIEVGGVDVMAYWKDGSGNNIEKTTYQDYVFSVAGDYVMSYSLQLAHTTNNNYTYEIFEADVSDVNPGDSGKIYGRDYIEYYLTDTYDPLVLKEISDNPVYENIEAGDPLYYTIKMDDSTPEKKKISLNGTNPTEPDPERVTPSSYTVGGETITYNGHYLNWDNYFAAKTTGDYHDATYGTYNRLNLHAEPLYWQANGISGGYPETRDSFYHEYILRISWTMEGAQKATSTYKDTDMIYITVKADD